MKHRNPLLFAAGLALVGIALNVTTPLVRNPHPGIFSIGLAA